MAVRFAQVSWFNQIINRLGRSLTRFPITKNVDPITGSETLVEGSSETIFGAFLQRNETWTFDKDGLIEGGDAYLITKNDQLIVKDDIIEKDGRRYRVQDVIERYSGDEQETLVYRYSNLFLRE